MQVADPSIAPLLPVLPQLIGPLIATMLISMGFLFRMLIIVNLGSLLPLSAIGIVGVSSPIPLLLLVLRLGLLIRFATHTPLLFCLRPGPLERDTSCQINLCQALTSTSSDI